MDQDLTIIKEPGCCAGQPTVGPTRLTVHTIVGLFELYDGDAAQILADYPHWTQAQLDAAMRYYADNRGEIDAILREQQEDYEAGLAAQMGKHA